MSYQTILQSFIAEKELIGKTIKWHAPAYKHNEDYTGISKILAVNTTDRRPLKTETIEGKNLDYAFINEQDKDDVENGLLCFSDGDRYVTFEVLN